MFQLARGESEAVADEATGVSPVMIYELLLSVLNIMTRDRADVQIVKPGMVEPPLAVMGQSPCQLREEAEAEEAPAGNGRRLVATTVARNPYTGLLHPVIRPVYYPISTHYPRYPTLVYG